MGIHYQLCFLASLLLVIHSGAISLPSDKDEAIAEDYLRDFSNLRDPASFLPEENIDPLSERENKMEKLPVSGMLDKEYLNGKWIQWIDVFFWKKTGRVSQIGEVSQFEEYISHHQTLVDQKRSTRAEEETHNMGIHYQLCFLASLLLVIHSGAISLPSDKDEAIAEDYLRDFSNLRDPASFLPEENIDPLSESENKMEKLPVSGMLDKEYLNGKWIHWIDVFFWKKTVRVSQIGEVSQFEEYISHHQTLVDQKRSTRAEEETHNMGIHYQLCFLASLLLVIHSGAISLPSDKDEAIAEDYLRDFSNLRDPASFLPEENIDPLSERENKMEKLPVSGMLDKEYLNRKWI
ncbi:hypothetical protein G5714_002686 [Onychostoma macrolepis]|uniref:Uncharacterized protein n=1 Tax=Onychostoma macrolepis TaxID=369639 RepID=A0A7J6D7G7_9TELE|nr:hypothetical protein G5714_002686 [Onychostoma macrolepis]